MRLNELKWPENEVGEVINSQHMHAAVIRITPDPNTFKELNC